MRRAPRELRTGQRLAMKRTAEQNTVGHNCQRHGLSQPAVEAKVLRPFTIPAPISAAGPKT